MMTPEPGKFYLATRAPDDNTPINADPLPFKVTLNNGVLIVWGFSIWKNSPGYRTYGIPFRELLDRHPGLIITEDRDRRVDPVPPESPRRSAGAGILVDHARVLVEAGVREAFREVGDRRPDVSALVDRVIARLLRMEGE